MGEASRRGASGGYYGALAPRLLMKAWFAAGSNERIEFTDGQLGDGSWLVVATIGSGSWLLTIDQVRAVASEFEATIGTPGTELLLQPVTDLVVALRAAADQVEQLHPVDLVEPASAPLPTPHMLPGLGG